MGKVFKSIFGGSSSKNSSQQTSQSTSGSQGASWNEAYPWLQNTYSPASTNGLQANDFLSALLGLHGNPAADDAFNKYKDDSGYGFIMDSGERAITGSAAARGLLNSGSTAKALTQFGQNTASQFYNNYLDRLLGLSNQGLQAGQLIGSAGQRSTNNSTSSTTSQGTSTGKSEQKPGIGAFIGSALSAASAGAGGA